MSSYDDVVQKDIELMWLILNYCRRTPWLSDKMDFIISKNPLKDIVIIIWVCFAVGIVEIGSKHFWVVFMNMVVSFAIRKLLEVKRPVEYDNRLQPLTDSNAESFGFPSLESHMSVVVLGHMFLVWKSVLFLPVAVFIILLVGFSRVYSRSRFPHQIVSSWISGVFGLLITMHCCDKMEIHKLSKHNHGVCVAVAILGVVCNFALSMENNDSRLVHIPKQDFVRVMSEIVSGGEGRATKDMVLERTSGQDDDEFDHDANEFEPSRKDRKRQLAESGKGGLTGESPRTAATQQAQGNIQAALLNRKKRAAVKSDSLYFLQKGMMEREARLREVVQQQYNTKSVHYFSKDSEAAIRSDTDDHTSLDSARKQ